MDENNGRKTSSLFSNLFTNHNKTSPDPRGDTNTKNDDEDITDKDKTEDESRENSPNMKRRYTQFGHFSHRPSCTAESDSVTVVISGLEVNNLFYVDRLWSPKPYLELTVGEKNTVSCLHLHFLFNLISLF